MDKELDDLAKKIAVRQIEVPSSSNARCIKRFYCEITSIIDNDRTIKSLALALNENGFNIKYDSLLKILMRLRKASDIKPITNEQKNIITREITTATPKEEAQRNNLTANDSAKKGEELANKYFKSDAQQMSDKYNKKMRYVDENGNEVQKTDIEPPRRRMTLREIEEETERERRENKRPLY